MKYLFLSDNEAVLAAQGKLTAIVRVMKPQPEYYMGSGWWCSWYRHYGSKEKLERDIIPYAPFLPGAIVPAKETWTLFIRGDGEHGFKRFIKYAADGEEIEVHDDKWEWWERQEKNGWGWRSPILMPAAAVRHRFLIKSVKAMLA